MHKVWLAALALLVFPAPAGATTAWVEDGVLRIAGTDGRDNVAVRYAALDTPVVYLRDAYKTMEVGPGCTALSDGTAQCPYDGLTAAEVHLGAGDDELYADLGLPLRAFGEDGDDRLFMRSVSSPRPTAPALLDGGAGDDRLAGGPGDDTLMGGPGDDGMDGSEGDDALDPGPGEDAVNDSAGNDRISARDGSIDHVDCGPGTDTGDFDAFDVARGCELGNLPAPAAPDCTPEIDPISSIAYATLRRTRALTVRATVETGCVLTARLATGRGPALATASARRGALRLALSGTALRRIHRARRFTVSILSTATGTTSTIRRSFTVRVR